VKEPVGKGNEPVGRPVKDGWGRVPVNEWWEKENDPVGLGNVNVPVNEGRLVGACLSSREEGPVGTRGGTVKDPVWVWDLCVKDPV